MTVDAEELKRFYVKDGVGLFSVDPEHEAVINGSHKSWLSMRRNVLNSKNDPIVAVPALGGAWVSSSSSAEMQAGELYVKDAVLVSSRSSGKGSN